MSKRWEIHYAFLDPVLGTEQAGNRPVLIISVDEFNEAMDRLTVLPITSRKPGRTVYANEALIGAGTAGLERDSIVLAHQIRTLSKRRLKRRIGEITDSKAQEAVLSALRNHLGMF